MLANYRRFQAGPDPLGRTWEVEFLWLQNAISIRHADAVDVKFLLRSGQERAAKVIALPHPLLLELSRRSGQPLCDPWVARLAAEYLRRMIETGEDLEKTLVEARPEVLTEIIAGARAA